MANQTIYSQVALRSKLIRILRAARSTMMIYAPGTPHKSNGTSMSHLGLSATQDNYGLIRIQRYPSNTFPSTGLNHTVDLHHQFRFTILLCMVVTLSSTVHRGLLPLETHACYPQDWTMYICQMAVRHTCLSLDFTTLQKLSLARQPKSVTTKTATTSISWRQKGPTSLL